jgi:hypothetical protein
VDGDTDTDSDSDSDTDSDSDADSDDSDTHEVCETLSVSIEGRPVKMMILQDLSSSMNDNNKWGQAQSALTNLLTRYENAIHFGLDVFPSGGECIVSDPLVMDCGVNGAVDIISLLPSLSPLRSTPLHLALSNFADPTYAPDFSAPDMERYLLLVSDGGDTCGTTGNGSSASAAELSDVARSLREAQGIQTIVIGFGLGNGQYEDGTALNAIAVAGGVLNEYIEVQDEAELTAALSDVGASIVGCVYDIGSRDSEEVNLDWVNVYFDGEALPRDDGCTQNTGWRWVDDSREAIEFCENACDALKNGDVTDVSVEIMCSESDVVVILV